VSAGAGVNFTDFEGLLPGVMSNLAQINPLQILQAFTNGASPNCQAITMETVDASNNSSTATAYVTNSDIINMNDSWFAAPGQSSKPDTSNEGATGSSESFTSMRDSNSNNSNNSNLKGSPIDYSAMPNDFFVKLYLSSLGLLGLYILLKMLLRKRLK